MFPAVVPEQHIHRFKFWADGKIQSAMRHGNDLYRHIACFPPEQRQQAYNLGIGLAQHGRTTVLTCSEREYAVWLVLRATSGATPTPPEPSTSPTPIASPSTALPAPAIEAHV